MQKRILIISAITALSLVLTANSLSAKPAAIGNMKEKMRHLFSKDYSNTDLLNILASIENAIRNEDMQEMRSKSEDISNYLNYRKNEMENHKEKIIAASVSYAGDKVLVLQYGSWLNSKEIILPLIVNQDPLKIDLLKNHAILASFQANEINNAKVRYVSYNIASKKTGISLHALLASLEEGSVDQVRDNVESIYDDILIDHEHKISLVAKIRDSLAVARFLVENGQSKAAQNSIGLTDSLMLRLIKVKADSPMEQERIEALRKELDDISKVSDANYLSEWEKIPEEIEGWWKKK